MRRQSKFDRIVKDLPNDGNEVICVKLNEEGKRIFLEDFENTVRSNVAILITINLKELLEKNEKELEKPTDFRMAEFKGIFWEYAIGDIVLRVVKMQWFVTE